MKKNTTSDILTTIVDHHNVLRQSIEVLKQDDATVAQKRKSLGQFLQVLQMHAHAEQETLYSVIREIKDLKSYALEGQEEHDIAESLLMQIQALDFQDEWNEEIASKAKVLAELVEHHIDEEEKEFFPAIKKYMIPVELEGLRDEYLARCERYLTQVEALPLVSSIVKGAVSRATLYVNRFTR